MIGFAARGGVVRMLSHPSVEDRRLRGEDGGLHGVRMGFQEDSASSSRKIAIASRAPADTTRRIARLATSKRARRLMYVYMPDKFRRRGRRAKSDEKDVPKGANKDHALRRIP